MSCPADSVLLPVPTLLFLTLTALLLLSGCGELDHGNGPLIEEPSFPLPPPAYPDVPNPGPPPVPLRIPSQAVMCFSGTVQDLNSLPSHHEHGFSMTGTEEVKGDAGQDTGQAPNRLIHEVSPYLLQHARNPVAWYAWGEEAFAQGSRRG